MYIDGNEKIYINAFTDTVSPRHEHDFLELAYITKGSIRHCMNGEEIVISKGNYFIVDYNTMHSYVKVGSDPIEVVNCLFFPGFIDKTLRECRSFGEVMNNYLIHHSYRSINANPANRIFFDDNRYVYEIITKLRREYEEKNTGYLEIMRCLLIEIIICTVRKIQDESSLVYNSVEKYIMDYVAENYMKKITLNEIAASLKYSPPYLSKSFRESYGMTFESFLQKTRVEQSCRLLANTDKKIIDIAECVGYTDLKFFNKVFKKIMNMPPREYRRLCK